MNFHRVTLHEKRLFRCFSLYPIVYMTHFSFSPSISIIAIHITKHTHLNSLIINHQNPVSSTNFQAAFGRLFDYLFTDIKQFYSLITLHFPYFAPRQINSIILIEFTLLTGTKSNGQIFSIKPGGCRGYLPMQRKNYLCPILTPVPGSITAAAEVLYNIPLNKGE